MFKEVYYIKIWHDASFKNITDNVDILEKSESFVACVIFLLENNKILESSCLSNFFIKFIFSELFRNF